MKRLASSCAFNAPQTCNLNPKTSSEMEKAFDQSSIRLTLRDGLAKGYWTLENLDQPSAGWSANERTWRRHPLNINMTHRPHENLLREPDDDDFYSSL